MSLSNKDFAAIYATAPASSGAGEAPKRKDDAKKGGGGEKKRHKPAAGQKCASPLLRMSCGVRMGCQAVESGWHRC
jgi:hypothetical protein